MRKMPYIVFAAFMLIGTIPLVALGASLKKASMIPHWIPQAQFAGYYVAKEKGIYRKHGIDLTIIAGGPNRLASDYLRDKKADFATLWLSTGISMRDNGTKVVNIAQMFQRSALMLVAKKSSGIRTVPDMDGKKVSLWDSIYQIQPKALFKKFGIKVKIIPQSLTVNLFLRDGVQVASAMWFNEYHTIINSGLNPDELVPFFFHDFNLNFPEDGIYTLEETLERDPDLCRTFVKASIEGWKYAFENPAESLDIVLKYLKQEHLPANRVHQKWMLNRIKDLMQAKDESIPMGKLAPEDFFRVVSELSRTQFIRNIHDYKTFHRNLSHEN